MTRVRIGERTVYAVTGSAGEYDDWRWWVVKIFACPAAAKNHADRCTTANQKAIKRWAADEEERDRDLEDRKRQGERSPNNDEWVEAYNKAEKRWVRTMKRHDPDNHASTGREVKYVVEEMVFVDDDDDAVEGGA